MASRATAYRSILPAERRDERRLDAQVTRATLEGLAQAPSPATLVDVSIYGCRLACESAHDPQEPVWLRLAGTGQIAATVVWSEGGMIGCRFDTPISRATLRSLTIRVV